MTQVRLNQEGDTFAVHAPRYSLKTQHDRPFVALCAPSGELIAELFIPSSIHTTRGQDDTTSVGVWCASADAGGVTLSLDARSTIWRAKTYSLRCEPARIIYTMAVEGEGDLTHVHYFGGYYSGAVRWGSGFFTDNWPCADRASWRTYLEVQPTLGIPSLYYVDHIDATGEPLEASDYAMLRSLWSDYSGAAVDQHV